MRACRLKGANCASRADLVQTHITARILACTGAAASSSSSSMRHGRRPIERRQSRANACSATAAAATASSSCGAWLGRFARAPVPLVACAVAFATLVYAFTFAWSTLLLVVALGSLLGLAAGHVTRPQTVVTRPQMKKCAKCPSSESNSRAYVARLERARTHTHTHTSSAGLFVFFLFDLAI